MPGLLENDAPPRRFTTRTLTIIGAVVVLAFAATVTVVVANSGTTSPPPAPPVAAPTTSAASPTTTAVPVSAGAETSAATILGWGEPERIDEFTGPLGPEWQLYNGVGHNGNGRRSPEAVSVADGMLTIKGDGAGTTGGLAWQPGQKYGRWEGRVRAAASDETYNALLLLWPDAEDWPVGGEVDFMELTDPSRQSGEFFLHYGRSNNQDQQDIQVDATQWHNWAVEWTPTSMIGYLDGKEWYRTDDKVKLPPRPMHLTIQLDWFPGNGDRNNVTPSTMEVDWVKEYGL